MFINASLFYVNSTSFITSTFNLKRLMVWISPVFVIGVWMVGVNTTAKQRCSPVFLHLKSMLYLTRTVSVGSLFAYFCQLFRVPLRVRLCRQSESEWHQPCWYYLSGGCSVTPNVPSHGISKAPWPAWCSIQVLHWQGIYLISMAFHLMLFLSQILPAHTGTLMAQTLIFVSSYFDFVRLRNYMKKEEISFSHLSE